MNFADDYVCADDEYDFSAVPEAETSDNAYGIGAEEVELSTVDMNETAILSLRERLLMIGFVKDPVTGEIKKDPAINFEPVRSWEGFFSTRVLSSDCTLDVYRELPNFKAEYYVEWFSAYTVAQLCKCVKAMVSGTLPTTDGGKAVRAYAGLCDLVDGVWVDKPDAKTLSLPVTNHLAASAQLFCASVDLKMKDRQVKIDGLDKLQTVTSPTLVPANIDGANTIDVSWKRLFMPLLQLPVDPKTGKKMGSDEYVRKAPFIWSVIGKKHGTEVVAGSNIRSMNYFLFWKKELYPLAGVPVKIDDFFNCSGPIISKALIARVIEHSIWVGGFPTPGDAIIAKFICSDGFVDDDNTRLPLAGSFSKGVIGFCTEQCSFEGPNVKYGNPDLDHDVTGISSNDCAAYTGVYWNPTVNKLKHLRNISGIAVPYSSAPGALGVAWDFIKERCRGGCRVYVTYGANPALWVIISKNGFKVNANVVSKMFKSCGWISILNLSISTARAFYNPGQKTNARYLKSLIWASELTPGSPKSPTWWVLEDDWVPGRWIDKVAAVDLSIPPDLWDDEDDYASDGPIGAISDDDDGVPAPKKSKK